ncbi:MAG TPA: cell surface protein, partial [Parvularcula sp.]|nr:cell surface protein [Parvularcula sp.]HBS30288.1 cell surface protein [Parvularcula sp.]HBS34410.1 cell surface protein [Parvularcula sp.]
MSEPKRSTALQYLDKAMGELRALGFAPEGGQPAPIVALLNQIAELDQDRVAAIARTLDQSSTFNEVVRN